MGSTRHQRPLLEVAFGEVDRLRRHYGEILDTLGFGPVTAPSRIIFSLAGMRLRDYGGPTNAPAFVIVAAPFKRAYIWDLAPEASVIRRLSERGFHPFLTRADAGAPKLVFEQNHGNAKTARHFQEFLRDRIVSSGTVLLGKLLEASDARSERGETSLLISKRPFHDPRPFPFWTTYSDN
jgi:hypothetical protein